VLGPESKLAQITRAAAGIIGNIDTYLTHPDTDPNSHDAAVARWYRADIMGNLGKIAANAGRTGEVETYFDSLYQSRAETQE